MRKWLAVAGIYLLFPWVTSLVWMQAAGAEPQKNAAAQEADGVRAGSGAGAASDTEQESGAAVANPASAAQVRRILVERGELRTYMTVEEYLPGVIACQIREEAEPGDSLEALKCQAVIARTYIWRLMEGRSEIHEEELDLDYPGSMDSGIFQDPAKRERAIARLKRCEQAVAETGGLVMKQNGRCILPLFHAVSAGRTRSGREDETYLQAVESRWDQQQKDFLTRNEFGRAEVSERLGRLSGGVLLTSEPLAHQIQIVEKDDSGYVRQVKIGARTYDGEEVQYALGLPSACYSMEAGNGSDTIRVISRGSGHGYGLSQAGAAGMAAEGWGFRDILHYYYKNISLVSE